MTEPVFVPYDELSAAALRSVVEEFVTREGTDYGHSLVSLDEKVAQVMTQLRRGEVAIAWDPAAESCSIIVKS